MRRPRATATAGSDFTGTTSETAAIAAGETSTLITVPVINDAVVEPNETFSVAISNARLGTATPLAITNGSAAVTIVSEDLAATGQTAFNTSRTPWLVDADGITIVGAAYDTGAQGVAFNDATSAQLGNASFRPGTAVDIVGNGAAVGWVENGEWVEYTINVETAGTYNLALSTAAVSSGRSVTASFEMGGLFYETTSPVLVPNTGAWNAVATTQPVALDLDARVQVVRLAFAGGSTDVRSLCITPQAVAPGDTDGVLDVADPFFRDSSNSGFLVEAGDKFTWTFDGSQPSGAPAGFGSGLTGLRVNRESSPQELGLGDAG